MNHPSQSLAGDAASYDRVPYTSYSYRETHPRKLQGVAHLHGIPAADVRACRVLELGCASGGNLVPMGEQLPQSRFLGVDYSAVQVGQARELAAGAGVGNAEFRHASIADLGPDVGQFDYIVCHGVFSWVDRGMQGHIFRVCQQLLTPNGVAYVSFNTLPGWHSRQWVREAMLFHTAGIEDPERRVEAGREFLRVLASSPLAKPHHAAVLREELGRIEGRPADYVIHDYLEDANEPVYFAEFMRRAGTYGLQYVADARVNGTPAEDAWGPAKGLLDSARGDVVRREQYADFLRNRSFRRAILCRAGVPVEREGREARVGGMWVTGQLREAGQAGDGRMTFASAGGATYWTREAEMVRAVRRVIEAQPGAVRVDEFPDGVRGELVKMWEANLVELYACPAEVGTGAGERPRGSGVARYLAGRTGPVTNLRHEMVMLDEAQRRVLGVCDGERGRADVARRAGVGEGQVGEVLRQLGRLGLFWAEG